ncbi:HNH endonuclease [Gordonia phage Sixama]|uniref:HNH endonuclease n=1 Tax=Gordonia phage Sixama TaxID=2653271 RepID=A0A5Q2F719_9CAUD|nr:HNH endonuclease [Gordonia phage Sixama]QGF20245.1 HNH endonuclease [Gordonia phage Sixama]
MRHYQRAVILLNVDYSPLETITWQRAVTLLVTGEAESVVDEPGQFIHSKSMTIPLPRTIKLKRYVHIEYRVVVLDEHSAATLAQILRRDKNRCGYCGEFASTVDHIFPQSRGGGNTWGNLIAACFDCNQLKADKTPEEAGMRLLWPPKAPEFDRHIQKTVWKDIAASEMEVNTN